MPKTSIRRGARIALAVAVAAGLSAAVVPAAPASAACNSVVTARWQSENGSVVAGWKLVQNRACTERWAQIVVDYQPDPTGLPYAVRIERQIKTPYGYAFQAGHSKISGVGAEGTWNTTHTKNESGENDKHRMCWGYAKRSGGKWVAPTSWANCTAWTF